MSLIAVQKKEIGKCKNGTKFTRQGSNTVYQVTVSGFGGKPEVHFEIYGDLRSPIFNTAQKDEIVTIVTD